MFISDFCANPPADVVLLMIAREWSKAHAGKWTEAMGRLATRCDAWEVKPHEFDGWVETRLRAKA